MNKIIILIKKGTKDYYFIRLVEELLNQKIRIILPKKISHFLPITNILLSSKVRLLHLHWIFFIGFDEKNQFRFLFKLCRFIIDFFISRYLLKVKIIWTIHNLYNHKSYYPHTERLVRKFLLKSIDAIICHCNQAKKIIHKEFGIRQEKIYIIPHGNYLNCYKNIISREKARDILGFKKKDFIFLHFGRIRRYKGIDTLIKSFQSLTLNNHIKVLIIGKALEDQYKKELINLSKDNKNIFLQFEFINDDKIQTYMNASDIIVSPYRSILTSGEVILAMSFGKPVIAPRLGCIIDVLNENGSFLYDPNEKKGLIKALELAISSKDRLIEMGKYNLKLVKDLDWRRISMITKEVYEKFLKKEN